MHDGVLDQRFHRAIMLRCTSMSAVLEGFFSDPSCHKVLPVHILYVMQHFLSLKMEMDIYLSHCFLIPLIHFWSGRTQSFGKPLEVVFIILLSHCWLTMGEEPFILPLEWQLFISNHIPWGSLFTWAWQEFYSGRSFSLSSHFLTHESHAAALVAGG